MIWVSNEPDNEKVYHVELDTVTVHFFAEDWEEFIALVQGALAVDGGGAKPSKSAKPKAAAAPAVSAAAEMTAEEPAAPEAPAAPKKRASSKKTPKTPTPETVIGELDPGAFEVGAGDLEIDHDLNMIDLTGEDDQDEA